MLGLQKGFTAQSRGLGAAELGPIGIRLEKVHKPPEDMLGLGHGPWSIESSLEGENWGHGNDGQRSPPPAPQRADPASSLSWPTLDRGPFLLLGSVMLLAKANCAWVSSPCSVTLG